MTTSFEFEGRNVEMALEKASAELNRPKGELEYDVLSYGSSGIFGLGGAKKARIRVSLPETAPGAGAEAGAVDPVMKPADEAADAPAHLPADIDHDPRTDQPLFTLPDDPLDLGRSVLQRIIDAITDDAEIRVDENSDRVMLQVVGGNAAILIGKRGQTLEAIQSLIEKVVNKHNHNRIRVLVDIEGYLQNRQANLEKMALRLAEKSIRIQKPISLGQMSAHDRRIIHLALKEHSDVRTQSKGEGHLRKLVIFPKKIRSIRKNGQSARS